MGNEVMTEVAELVSCAVERSCLGLLLKWVTERGMLITTKACIFPIYIRIKFVFTPGPTRSWLNLRVFSLWVHWHSLFLFWISSVVLHFAKWLFHHHLSLNREGRWGITDDFTTSFLHFFPDLDRPLGLGELQACPFTDVVFHPLPLLPCLLPPWKEKGEVTF